MWDAHLAESLFKTRSSLAIHPH
ncbi:DUF6783 domain-containing protein [Blautia faecis]